MKLGKKLFALLTVFSLFCSTLFVSILPVHASSDPDVLISQLIGYYSDYQEDANTDIERVLTELKTVDSKKGEAWEKIMNYWSQVNQENFTNVGTIPNNLPHDQSVAIVILGFALNNDGTMKDELIGRLQTGLNIAKAYPKAYVVVTGGGTAKDNPNVTEGGLMGEWLLEQGLEPSRLIVENRAPDTVGNAKNTYEILKSKYSSVDKVVLVTSDYHVPRGCILYYTKFVLEALENNSEPLTIISNSGYQTGSKGYESLKLQAMGISQMAGIDPRKVPQKQELSQLDSLEIKQNKEFVKGENLDLTIIAHYTNGYSKDVTKETTINDFDKNKESSQTVMITYSENNKTISIPYKVEYKKQEVIKEDKENKTDKETIKQDNKNKKNTTSPSTGDTTMISYYFGIAIVSALFIGFFYLRKS